MVTKKVKKTKLFLFRVQETFDKSFSESDRFLIECSSEKEAEMLAKEYREFLNYEGGMSSYSVYCDFSGNGNCNLTAEKFRKKFEKKLERFRSKRRSDQEEYIKKSLAFLQSKKSSESRIYYCKSFNELAKYIKQLMQNLDWSKFGVSSKDEMLALIEKLQNEKEVQDSNGFLTFEEIQFKRSIVNRLQAIKDCEINSYSDLRDFIDGVKENEEIHLNSLVKIQNQLLKMNSVITKDELTKLIEILEIKRICTFILKTQEERDDLSNTISEILGPLCRGNKNKEKLELYAKRFRVSPHELKDMYREAARTQKRIEKEYADYFNHL